MLNVTNDKVCGKSRVRNNSRGVSVLECGAYSVVEGSGTVV